MMHQRDDQENVPPEDKAEGSNEALPNMSLIQMTQGFQSFISKIGPLVDAHEFVFNIMSLKDTRDSVTFGAIMTYCIIY